MWTAAGLCDVHVQAEALRTATSSGPGGSSIIGPMWRRCAADAFERTRDLKVPGRVQNLKWGFI